MTTHVLNNIDTSYLDPILLEKGLLKVVQSSVLSSIPVEHLTIYGHKNGFYCFPTTELADWLKDNFDLSSAIEIGAGHGSLARYLKIPATDSRFMETEQIAAYYKMLGQPTTKYPNDIIKLDAISAIKKYKPKTVIGCWVTHKYSEQEHERGGNLWGIDEELLVNEVEQYIVIGNENVHNKKKILERPHKEHKFSWLHSRSLEPMKNIIYVWDNSNI